MIKKQNNNIKDYIFYIFYALLFIGASFYLVNNALDRYFDNQDRMLCHSATISGNEEWAEKCSCYYKGEDISCINFKKGYIEQ